MARRQHPACRVWHGDLVPKAMSAITWQFPWEHGGASGRNRAGANAAVAKKRLLRGGAYTFHAKPETQLGGGKQAGSSIRNERNKGSQ